MYLAQNDFFLTVFFRGWSYMVSQASVELTGYLRLDWNLIISPRNLSESAFQMWGDRHVLQASYL